MALAMMLSIAFATSGYATVSEGAAAYALPSVDGQSAIQQFSVGPTGTLSSSSPSRAHRDHRVTCSWPLPGETQLILTPQPRSILSASTLSFRRPGKETAMTQHILALDTA